MITVHNNFLEELHSYFTEINMRDGDEQGFIDQIDLYFKHPPDCPDCKEVQDFFDE